MDRFFPCFSRVLPVCSSSNITSPSCSASVPWITLHRDIHHGYPQVNLEAQLSTDIHRWMMWISTTGYIGPWESQGRETFQRLVHILFFKTMKCISQQLKINSDGLAHIKCRVGLLVACWIWKNHNAMLIRKEDVSKQWVWINRSHTARRCASFERSWSYHSMLMGLPGSRSYR